MLFDLKLLPLKYKMKYKMRSIRKHVNGTFHGGCAEEGDVFSLAVTQGKQLLWQTSSSSFQGLAACSDIVCSTSFQLFGCGLCCSQQVMIIYSYKTCSTSEDSK